MKRDWNTIRELLTRLEESGSSSAALQLGDFAADRADEVAYHMELLIEAGLVKGTVDFHMGQSRGDFLVDRLTWEGHEFLDTVRSSQVWDKTKDEFQRSGVSMTFDLIKSVAGRIARAILETAIGG